MTARACEHCGGRLLRDLELGAEVFSTEPVLKCINCGRVPGVRRAPTAEESGASGVRREATPRAVGMPVEMLREASASEIARLIGRSHHYVVSQLKKIPAAYQTEGGHWRCPLWAWQRHQEQGDRS